MKDLKVSVSRETRMVSLPKEFISVDGENLQSNLVFIFSDEFVNGQGRLEYKINSTKNYIPLTKTNESYEVPIKNVITKKGKIQMQLVITEGMNDEEIPVFKSNIFYLYCNESINAVTEAPDGYELWIEQANAKLNQMDEALAEVDNLDIDVSKSGTTSTVTITKKDGTEKSVEIYDGNAQEIDMKEDKINKTTSIDGASTDIQYPSARCVFRTIEAHNESFASHLDIRAALRNKQNVILDATPDNIATFDSDGNVKDSKKSFNDFIVEKEIPRNNLFNISSAEKDARINQEGGIDEVSGWITSLEILLEEDEEYSMALIDTNGNVLEGTIKFGYAFYDLEHNLIGNYIYSSRASTQINFLPQEKGYLRFSIQKNDANGTNFPGYKMMVCKKDYLDNGGGYEEYIAEGTVLYNKLPNINQEEIDKNVLSKVDDIKREITLENTDKIMILGDSATASYYTIKDKAYISKISELSDYEFENYGVSGKTLEDAMINMSTNAKLYNSVYGYQDIKPKYTMIMCYMNDIKNDNPNTYMENLSDTIDMIRKFGSEPIICTEHLYKYCDYDINMFTEIAERKNCKLMDVEKFAKQTIGENYLPHWGNGHPGTRTNNLYSDNLLYYLDKLPEPTKGLKIYRVRNDVDISNLNNVYFNDKYEKINIFKEISTGHVCLFGNDIEYFDDNGINPFTDNLNQSILAKFEITDFGGVSVEVGETYTTNDISDVIFTINIIENNRIYCLMSSTENNFSVGSGTLINTTDNTKTLNYTSGISISNTATTVNSEYLALRNEQNIAFNKLLLVTATLPNPAHQTSYVGLNINVDSNIDVYVKGLGGYIEIENVDGDKNYAIPTELLESCIDGDKVHFLVKSVGQFNVDKIKVVYAGTGEKQWEENSFNFVEPLGEEIIETTTFENISTDEFWTKTGIIMPLVANDSCYPSNATKIIKVNNENYISCNINLDGGLFGKTYILDVYARYNPNSEKITYNSVDYKKLNVISKVLGTRPLSTGIEIYNKEEIIGLHWKICRFEITAPSGANDINLEILGSDETNLEIAKVSLKEPKSSDIPTEETITEWGFTKNIGTVTGITMNGTSKGTSGIVDLGTVITDISGKQNIIDNEHKLSADLVSDGITNKTVTENEKNTWNNKSNFSGNYNDLTNKPTIPDVSNFITKDVNDLTYYYTKTEVNNKLLDKQDVIQISSVEDINATFNNKTIQWIGQTTTTGGYNLINGCFYKLSVTEQKQAIIKEVVSVNTYSATMNNQSTFLQVYSENGEYDFIYDSSTTSWVYGQDSYSQISMLFTLGIYVEAGEYTNGDIIKVEVGVLPSITYTSVDGNNKTYYAKESSVTYAQITDALTKYEEIVLDNYFYIGTKAYISETIYNLYLFGKIDSDGNIIIKGLRNDDVWIDYNTISPIQVKEIPSASSSTENFILQYIGTTNATYTNGYFYKCIGTQSPNQTSTITYSNTGVLWIFNQETFRQTFPNNGTYVFTYNGTNWEDENQTEYTNAELGISPLIGSMSVGDTATVVTINEITYAWNRIDVQPSGGGSSTDVQINGTSIVSSGTANIVTESVYNASSNKIVTMSDLPDISTKQDTIDSSHKLSADLVDDTSTTNKFVTVSDKTTWNGKYTKPSGGIPNTDLSSAVQTSLGKADTALQSETYTGTITSIKMNGSTISTSGEANLGTVITSHQDISGKLDTNKVKTTTSTTSGDVYDVTYINTMLGDIESLLSGV